MPIRFRLSSLLILVVVAGLAFAVLRHVDAQRRSTCTYQVEAMRTAIGNAARLEIMMSQIDPGNRPVGDTFFFVIEGNAELRRLSDESLWPATSEFVVFDPDAGPMGWKPLRSVLVQVVPHSGAPQSLMLQDYTATLHGRLVRDPLKMFEHALLDVLHDLREDGRVTKVRDHQHAIELFTGLADKIRARKDQGV